MLKWIAKKWHKYDIMKNVDGVDVIYLRRYFIWRSKYFNIFLHYIGLPDTDQDPHDHPWSFVSVLLRGGYKEDVFSNRQESKRNIRKAFSIGRRTAETVHQIRECLPNTWTLVFTGPERRDWGFLTENGWMFWRKYLNVWHEVDMD